MLHKLKVTVSNLSKAEEIKVSAEDTWLSAFTGFHMYKSTLFKLILQTMSPYPMGTGNSSMAVTKWKFEADHSFQFCAKVKNTPLLASSLCSTSVQGQALPLIIISNTPMTPLNSGGQMDVNLNMHVENSICSKYQKIYKFLESSQKVGGIGLRSASF
jgi:hypothetical protein